MIKPYYQDNYATIYLGNCLEIMPELDPVDLIPTDPPYNINKAEWDKIPDYLEWCGKWLLACQDALKDNGSFYFFHNDMPTIARLMTWIEENTRFVFKQLVVWNKRFEEAGNLGFLNGFIEVNDLRNYQKMAEYLLFYTFQDETGLTQVYDNQDCFRSIKEYLRIERNKTREAGFSDKDLRTLCGVSLKGGGLLCHYWGNAQWQLPIKEHYEKLQTTGYFQHPYEDLRLEYENLRCEYEDLRYTFNNQKTHHSVWNYEIADKIGHVTPKPVDLISNIILHSSNEGDMILDPFMGSGTTLMAARQLNRRCIGIDTEERFCEITVKRLAQEPLNFNTV